MVATAPPVVEAELHGLFAPDFSVPASSGRLVIDVGCYELTDGMLPPTSMSIHDARQRQATAARDASFLESAFFKEHGFILLHHESAVRDWDSGSVVDPSRGGSGAVPAATNDIANIYLPEMDALIRTRLLPGVGIEIQQPPALLRRGPGTANPYYGLAVHNDYGLTADDYQDNLEAFGTPEAAQGWRDRYEQDDVRGYLTINFWRTVYMDEPLRHMPLAVCEPRSISADDLVPSGLANFTSTGKVSNQQNLRYSPGHRWHYYPRMTSDEVLAFKNFQCMKSDAAPVLHSCFHTAFAEPGASPHVQKRQSCEHRVGVFFLD